MKWVTLVSALAVAAALAQPAAAKAPCRDRIYDDWKKDGKIASTYPLSCYRDALKHIGSGDSVYTSLEDDIRSALQAAVLRSHGQKVAAQVGHGFPASTTSTTKSSSPEMMDERTHPLASATSTVASLQTGDTSGGGGVPLPLLVLGGFALVLVVAGGAGLLVRANRGSGPGA
jgi:hypothetical protein